MTDQDRARWVAAVVATGTTINITADRDRGSLRRSPRGPALCAVQDAQDHRGSRLDAMHDDVRSCAAATPANAAFGVSTREMNMLSVRVPVPAVRSPEGTSQQHRRAWKACPPRL
jgi:hypothetical protein